MTSAARTSDATRTPLRKEVTSVAGAFTMYEGKLEEDRDWDAKRRDAALGARKA